MDDKLKQNYISNESLPKKNSRGAYIFWVLALVVVLLGLSAVLVYKTSFTFSQMNEPVETLPFAANTPKPDPDRLNILVLGLRGEEDPNGGLLTDSVIVVSIKKSTNQVALISIPRDLYVMMPGENYKEKINYTFALGHKKQGMAGGLLYSKVKISEVIGLYIDHAIAINHTAFKDIVDALGGVDIFLDKPFIEDQQWIQGGDVGYSSAFVIQTENVNSAKNASSTTDVASSTKSAVVSSKWIFKIPVGKYHLDGNTALYYCRARYASSDFDRARRQQQVMTAAKDKVLSLGVLANPVKTYQLLDALGKNIKTDISASDVKNLVFLTQKLDFQNMPKKVFDTTPEGLLYAGHSDAGAYILLPQDDDFSKIRDACKNIFNQ